MAVVIDISRALRTLGDPSSFVRAIAAALPEDKLDWIEWKCAGFWAIAPSMVPYRLVMCSRSYQKGDIRRAENRF
jgi:hypothetical protein